MDNRGLEKLDQWLLKYGNDDSILSASELDGYFAAIVSGPVSYTHLDVYKRQI